MTILDKIFQPVWEISSEPIVITSNDKDPEDRRILHVNSAFTRVTGFTAEESIGQPPSMLHGPGTESEVIRLSEDQLRAGLSQEKAYPCASAAISIL